MLTDRLSHRNQHKKNFDQRVIELNRGQLIVYKNELDGKRTKYQVQLIDEILYFSIVDKQQILIRGINETCMTLGFQHDPSLFPKWLKALEEVTESVSIDALIEVEDQLKVGTLDDRAHVLLTTHELLIFHDIDACDRFRNAYLSQNHGQEAYLQLIDDTTFCSLSMTAQTKLIEENEYSFHVADGTVRLRFTADSPGQAQNWSALINEKRHKATTAGLMYSSSADPDTQSAASVPIQREKRISGGRQYSHNYHNTAYTLPYEADFQRRSEEGYFSSKFLGPTPYGPPDMPSGSARRGTSRGLTPGRDYSNPRHLPFDARQDPFTTGFGPPVNFPGDYRDPTYLFHQTADFSEPGYVPERRTVSTQPVRRHEASQVDEYAESGNDKRVKIAEEGKLYMSDVTSDVGLYQEKMIQPLLEVDTDTLNKIKETEEAESNDKKAKALEILSMATSFQKLKKRGKARSTNVVYDPESKSICWGNSIHKRMHLRDISYVVRGKQTAQFVKVME